MPIPQNYYLAPLEHMVRWVQRHHDSLLDARVREFVQRFGGLPESSRRLLARLLHRQGNRFRVDRTRYPEVGSTELALRSLHAAGMTAPVTDVDAVVECMTVREIRELAERVAMAVRELPEDWCAATRGLRRGDLVEHVLPVIRKCAQHGAFAGDRDELPQVFDAHWADDFDYLRLLYFGSLAHDLTEFVLADISVMRWTTVCPRPQLPWREPSEVRASLAVQRAADLTHLLGAQTGAQASTTPPELSEIAAACTQALVQTPVDGHSRRRRQRAIQRLAEFRMGRGEMGAACALLLGLDTPSGRERACRLLAAHDRQESVRALLACWQQRPPTARDEDFARRFDPERGRCRPRPRQKWRPRTHRMVLPHVPGRQVEAIAASWYRAAGNHCEHLENRLPGLIFLLGAHDIIHAPRPGAFLHAFQSGPVDLFEPAFVTASRTRLDARVRAIESGDYGLGCFLSVLQRERGTVNPFFPWHAASIAMIPAILRSLGPLGRSALFRHVAEDPRRARRGFPDLVVCGDGPGCIRFVEVKGPGDQLRPEQVEWLRALEVMALAAHVLEVRWA